MIGAVKVISIEESYRASAYYCSEGYPTIGIGKRIGPKGADLSLYEFTVSEDVSKAWLNEEVANIEKLLNVRFTWYGQLCQQRKDVLISMCYQLGFQGFQGFQKTIKLIKSSCFESAANEMLDSKWAKQTPGRAKRHSDIFKAGNYDATDYYK